MEESSTTGSRSVKICPRRNRHRRLEITETLNSFIRLIDNLICHKNPRNTGTHALSQLDLNLKSAIHLQNINELFTKNLGYFHQQNSRDHQFSQIAQFSQRLYYFKKEVLNNISQINDWIENINYSISTQMKEVMENFLYSLVNDRPLVLRQLQWKQISRAMQNDDDFNSSSSTSGNYACMKTSIGDSQAENRSHERQAEEDNKERNRQNSSEIDDANGETIVVKQVHQQTEFYSTYKQFEIREDFLWVENNSNNSTESPEVIDDDDEENFQEGQPQSYQYQNQNYLVSELNQNTIDYLQENIFESQFDCD